MWNFVYGSGWTGGKEESGERESIRSVVEEWMEMTIRLAVPHGILFGRFSVDDGVRHLVELCDRLPISFASRLLSHLLTWNGKEVRRTERRGRWEKKMGDRWE